VSPLVPSDPDFRGGKKGETMKKMKKIFFSLFPPKKRFPPLKK
jgi:hypothetical protein